MRLGACTENAQIILPLTDHAELMSVCVCVFTPALAVWPSWEFVQPCSPLHRIPVNFAHGCRTTRFFPSWCRSPDRQLCASRPPKASMTKSMPDLSSTSQNPDHEIALEHTSLNDSDCTESRGQCRTTYQNLTDAPLSLIICSVAAVGVMSHAGPGESNGGGSGAGGKCIQAMRSTAETQPSCSCEFFACPASPGTSGFRRSDF